MLMTQTSYKTIRKRSQIGLDFMRSLNVPDPKYIVVLKTIPGCVHVLGVFSSEETAMKRVIDYINKRYNINITDYGTTGLYNALKISDAEIEIVKCIIDDEETDLRLS